MDNTKQYKWQWYSNTIGWKDYDDKLSGKIDEVYITGNARYSFKIRANNTKYDIDFDAMVQRNLDTNKIRNIRRQTIIINIEYVPFAFNENAKQYILCYGYIRYIEKTMKLSFIIPSTIIKLIYSYQQYYIVSNDLCNIDPIQQILTSPGIAKKWNTHIILSKPLKSGVYEFKIQCLNSTKKSISIGIVSELNVGVPYEKRLFVERVSGIDCYELHLRRTSNRIFKIYIHHLMLGKIIESQRIQDIKFEVMEKGDICSMIIDFDMFKVTFFINSVPLGTSLKLIQDMTYYAAFMCSVDNEWIHETGPCKFQYSLTEQV